MTQHLMAFVILSYIVLRDSWLHIIVLNAHSPTRNRVDDVKDSVYEELEYTFVNFRKYHMKMLLGDFYPRGQGRHF
jgi:hypothetical protein